jgi:putative Holliday junction resolvase
MAIDYGGRRVGLAISDPLGIVATGAGVVRNDSRLVGTILRMITEQNVRHVVVGMPYRADGSRGTRAKDIDRFIECLREGTAVPIETWDESFTSVEAAGIFREGGMKRKQRREKGRIDEMAARLLLQEFLDSRGRKQGSGT